MSVKNVYRRFKPFENIFKCPICGCSMEFKNDNSLVCLKNHCFDLSKHRYINFAPRQSKMKYTKNLFESRRNIFKAGFYNELAEAVNYITKQHTLDGVVLDAGCGEGFFSSFFANAIPEKDNVFALDLSKEAIILASSENHAVKWMVGDLSAIPLQSDSVQVLLNIFSPANYSEFLRVATDDCLIVKVVPGTHYLYELRESAGYQLNNTSYSNDDVVQHFCKNTVLLNKKTVFYELPVAQNHAEDFINMTPMMFNINKAAINHSNLTKVTIDAEILVGMRR